MRWVRSMRCNSRWWQSGVKLLSSSFRKVLNVSESETNKSWNPRTQETGWCQITKRGLQSCCQAGMTREDFREMNISRSLEHIFSHTWWLLWRWWFSMVVDVVVQISLTVIFRWFQLVSWLNLSAFWMRDKKVVVCDFSIGSKRSWSNIR